MRSMAGSPASRAAPHVGSTHQGACAMGLLRGAAVAVEQTARKANNVKTRRRMLPLIGCQALRLHPRHVRMRTPDRCFKAGTLPRPAVLRANALDGSTGLR